MEIAKTSMLELGRIQAEMFMANNYSYCEILVKASCPRTILVMAYNRLVRESKLVPIEDLLQEQKEQAWETAKELAKGRLGRNALVDLVKSLLAIEYFLNV